MSSLRAQSNATGGGDKPLLCDDTTQALLVTFPAGGGGGGTSDTTEATQLLVKTAVEAINTETGSLTETAPATDTASSGLNGRLQRVAQHLTNVVSYTSRLLSSAGPKAAGSALATTAFQVGGTYNSALPTMTNTQEAGLQLNVNGRLLASNSLEAGSAIVGHFGIDQTTPGTTDSVTVKTRTKTVTTLLSAVTSNQTSSVLAVPTGRRTITASIAGTGAVSATVSWYGNNTNSSTDGVLFATSTLSGTTTDKTGADIVAEWPFVYCILTAISGTSAAVTARLGV